MELRNERTPTNEQEAPSSEPSGKAKSFVESLEAARLETIRKGYHVSYAGVELVPRSLLNYPEGGSSSISQGTAQDSGVPVIRILPPKEDLRKLLENPSLICDEAKEIERELARELGLV